ncbi:LacI family transcriptional regulator [Carbonactinospora thermoautotrophica]|uniref:LacI family DNA-binding transcriptional regulator n=1 Tax=Carbonactinospora thermoautotrophica TaxID=1469144 RepID=UPI0022717CAE|nr:LacI family DNA-binding transcriptional regulator [Carbonactinospora thermoautotrophica]MCX9193390.1 LacI family transcriptional regulator [Carbonactinospora thermoautotrophica]
MPRKDARRATLNDVARVAGVSRQTVSNALNAPHLLRPDTLAQVRTAIDRLGYRPNRNARSLRTRRSCLIGYRIYPSHPDRLGWVLDRFLHAVADAARVAGYHLVVFTPDDEAREVDTYTALVQTRSVDGFLLSGVRHEDEVARWLHRRKVPFVAYGRLPEESGDAWVDVDNAAGTALAVDHLVALGHRRIAFLGWAEGDRIGDERARGWRAAMERHGLTGPLIRGHTPDRIPATRAAAERLLELADPPTAVVAASDTIAVGVLQAARARGVSVGRDLAVVGFDDTPSAALLTPTLTSVSQPVEEAARLLVDMLVTRLAGHRPSRRAVLLEPTLVVRESSCPLPAPVAES